MQIVFVVENFNSCIQGLIKICWKTLVVALFALHLLFTCTILHLLLLAQAPAAMEEFKTTNCIQEDTHHRRANCPGDPRDQYQLEVNKIIFASCTVCNKYLNRYRPEPRPLSTISVQETL